MNQPVIPVILCGGSGTRLWPASREEFPKQFLNLMGARSLLQETARRALALSGAAPDRLVTVTLGALAGEVGRQLTAFDPACARHILSEPSARNTAAAVALAALHVKAAFGGEALLWVLPADHHIADENALAEGLRLGIIAAGQDRLVTFGIKPTRPDTGYGYINLGAALDGHANIRPITRFVEKPDAATAQSYLDAGTYLWNSGMFLFRADAVLAQFRRHAPDILAATEAAAAHGRIDPALYAAIPELPFDKAVMERSADGVVIPCDPQWSDIGSWESLWDVRGKDSAGNAASGDVVAVDTADCLIESLGGRLVACAGLRDIVVVDTGDAVLVADRTNTDAVKALVKELKARQRAETVSRPKH